MNFRDNFKTTIYKVNESSFEKEALALFLYQYSNNVIYKAYVDALRISPSSVTNIAKIPFLPISFFKTHKVVTGDLPIEKAFLSSGTTGMERSIHYVSDTALYKDISKTGFEQIYGPLKDIILLALLPSYEDNPDASLLFMINAFMENAAEGSSFVTEDFEMLVEKIRRARSSGKKVLLWGVTYALLDFSEQTSFDANGVIVMETGGMKGRRKEMVKTEVHSLLKERLKLDAIHSEYGMTELLSQAYSTGNDIFKTPAWLKIMVRDTGDPLDVQKTGRGGMNIIDLANIDSCAFIETSDMGSILDNGSFEVMGRIDNSDIRGCNMLYNH